MPRRKNRKINTKKAVVRGLGPTVAGRALRKKEPDVTKIAKKLKTAPSVVYNWIRGVSCPLQRSVLELQRHYGIRPGSWYVFLDAREGTRKKR